MPKATKRERQRINRELRREAVKKAEQRQRRFRLARNFVIALVIVGIVFGAIKLIQGDDDSSTSNAVSCSDVKAGKGTNQQFSSAPEMTIDPAASYVAVMDTSCGNITVALDAATYPVGVNNFVFLAQQKFYDGLDFVRAAKGFTIQAGSPDNSQSGGPGYSVLGEVPTSDPAYPVGAFAMAKSGAEPAGTAGSQFFVITGTRNLTLPPDYAYLGMVTKGLDVAKKITSFAPESGDGPPTKVVKINKVTITTTPTPAATTTTPAP